MFLIFEILQANVFGVSQKVSERGAMLNWLLKGGCSLIGRRLSQDNASKESICTNVGGVVE